MLEKIINKLNNVQNETDFSQQLLSIICKEMEISQAAFYIVRKNKLHFIAGFAYHLEDADSLVFEMGDGLVGQAASDGKPMNITQIPEGYMNITSGLGQSSPTNLLIFPFKRDEEKVRAVAELGSFKSFTEEQLNELNTISNFIVENISKWE